MFNFWWVLPAHWSISQYFPLFPTLFSISLGGIHWYFLPDTFRTAKLLTSLIYPYNTPYMCVILMALDISAPTVHYGSHFMICISGQPPYMTIYKNWVSLKLNGRVSCTRYFLQILYIQIHFKSSKSTCKTNVLLGGLCNRIDWDFISVKSFIIDRDISPKSRCLTAQRSTATVAFEVLYMYQISTDLQRSTYITPHTCVFVCIYVYACVGYVYICMHTGIEIN